MNFRQAEYKDIRKIQDFIRENYRKDHVLGNSKALFVQEYLNTYNNLNPSQKINFYVAEKGNTIESILGFYEQTKEICLSMWVGKDKTSAGIQLLNYVTKIFEKPIVVVGISNSAKKVYEALDYKFGDLKYYGYVAETTIEHNKLDIKQEVFDHQDLVTEQLLYPYDEYIRRVVNNHFREYNFIKIENTIFVYRLIRADFALIVDVIGKRNQLEQKIRKLACKLKVTGVSIWTNIELKLEYCENLNFNFSCSDINRKISNKIDYCSNDGAPRFITKLWGDQDRLGRLNDKYALVNNFMYHFIRDDNTVSHSRSEKRFKADISYLLSNYKPISIIELKTGQFDPLNEYFTVSFDDYYIEHEHFVAPYLEKLGIEAQFFVPFNKSEVLKVNKIQQILRYVKHDVIYNILESRGGIPEVVEKNNTFDDDEIFTLKRILQSSDIDLIDQLYRQCPRNISYGTNISKVGKMHYVGAHTVSHSHMIDQSDEEIKLELQECEKNLPLSHINIAKGIAYPYGSYDNRILKLVKNEGYKFGWTTKRTYGVIGTEGNLEISRFDCNDLDILQVDCGDNNVLS